MHDSASGRLANWEARFAAFIAYVHMRPYDARSWNCCLFARACVRAITGRSLPREWHGSIEQTADAYFARYRYPADARRGDLVMARLPSGATLGVCLGARSAFVGPAGLTRLRSSRAVMAWMVG